MNEPATPQTTSILNKLAVTPMGTYGSPLDWNDLREHLMATIGTVQEDARNKRHELRDALYRDGGVEYMENVIDDVFEDDDVKRLRKKWVRFARFNNPVKRIVNEISTVYAEAPERTIASDTAENFATLLKDTKFNLEMFHASRLLNLHRTLLVGFRVRQHDDGRRDPVIDVATPASVRAVVSPADNKLVIGWLIRSGYASPTRLTADDNKPAWTLWTDHEKVLLNARFTALEGTYLEHGFGVCPWVPVVLGPACAGFWPGEEGEDLVAGAVSVWMSNILLLKEQKSATKQTIVNGDTSTMPRGQALDTERPLVAPEGTSATTVDMSMDLSMFRDNGNHVLDCLANNYGMSPAIVRHEGVQSAEARDLLRIPLREIRLYQQAPWHDFEALFFGRVVPSVLRVDLPDRIYDPAGFRVKFGESQTPMSKSEELKFFTDGRAAGVDDTVAYILRQNPGMTVEDAMAEVERHNAVETWRGVISRPLQAISGSTKVTGVNAVDPTTVEPIAADTMSNVSHVDTPPA